MIMTKMRMRVIEWEQREEKSISRDGLLEVTL